MKNIHKSFMRLWRYKKSGNTLAHGFNQAQHFHDSHHNIHQQHDGTYLLGSGFRCLVQ